MTKTAGFKSLQATFLADPYGVAARGAFWLSGVVAVGTLAVALYALTPSIGVDRSSAALTQDTVSARWSPIAAEPAAEAEPVGEPVRVANPFDASEVFEFPAGTTPAEARAMMSDMLMERARQRYARLDKRS